MPFLFLKVSSFGHGFCCSCFLSNTMDLSLFFKWFLLFRRMWRGMRYRLVFVCGLVMPSHRVFLHLLIQFWPNLDKWCVMSSEAFVTSCIIPVSDNWEKNVNLFPPETNRRKKIRCPCYMCFCFFQEGMSEPKSSIWHTLQGSSNPHRFGDHTLEGNRRQIA